MCVCALEEEEKKEYERTLRLLRPRLTYNLFFSMTYLSFLQFFSSTKEEKQRRQQNNNSDDKKKRMIALWVEPTFSLCLSMK